MKYNTDKKPFMNLHWNDNVYHQMSVVNDLSSTCWEYNYPYIPVYFIPFTVALTLQFVLV